MAIRPAQTSRDPADRPAEQWMVGSAVTGPMTSFRRLLMQHRAHWPGFGWSGSLHVGQSSRPGGGAQSAQSGACRVPAAIAVWVPQLEQIADRCWHVGHHGRPDVMQQLPTTGEREFWRVVRDEPEGDEPWWLMVRAWVRELRGQRWRAQMVAAICARIAWRSMSVVKPRDWSIAGMGLGRSGWGPPRRVRICRARGSL